MPFGLPQTSVSKPVNTVRSALDASKDLKPPVQPTISTEATVQNDVRDRTKSDQGAGSQRAPAQPGVKFARDDHIIRSSLSKLKLAEF